jgi:hypothetical protein
MAGVAPGNPANISIDADGYLHLRIIRQDEKWTASELFTTETLGFGTYQWIVEGNVYARIHRLQLVHLRPPITSAQTRKTKSTSSFAMEDRSRMQCRLYRLSCHRTSQTRVSSGRQLSGQR